MMRLMTTLTLYLGLSGVVLAADYRDKWSGVENIGASGDSSTSLGLIVEELPGIESVALRATDDDLIVRSGRSKVDLTPYFPKPGNQGRQSSCVGWALAYIHTYHDQRLGGDGGMSSPAWIYNQIQRNGCHVGSRIKDGMVLLNEQGALKNAEHPYTTKSCNAIPAGMETMAQSRRLAGYAVLDLSNIVKHTKVHIDAGIPVAVGFRVYENFSKWQNGATNYQQSDGIYSAVSGVSYGGHAMAVIGFDDTKKAMKVINSWGSDWGEGGYAWIDYEVFEKLTWYAYAAYGHDQQAVGGITSQQFDGIRIEYSEEPDKCDANDVLTSVYDCQ